MRPLSLRDLGVLSYEEALTLQYAAVEAVRTGAEQDTLFLVEHPAVFTLGRRRTAAGNVLNAGATPVVQVERGGDVTWHGPGQLVAYPVLALQDGERDVHAVLRSLEHAVIAVLSLYGLVAEGGREHTGVWVGEQKIASVGVAVRDWVTYHGVALNVHPDLSWFTRINPCGLGAKVMTSMEAQGIAPPEPSAIRKQMASALAEAFERTLVEPLG